MFSLAGNLPPPDVTPTLLATRQVDFGRNERKGNGRTLDNGVLLALMAAFISLIIATLTYSVLAGETESGAHARAATEELVDGLPFGLAVIMLFKGMTLLLQEGNIDKVAVRTAHVMTVVVGPGLTLFYLANGTTDTESIRATNLASICTQAPIPTLGLVLSGVLATTLMLSLVPRFQPPIMRSWAARLQNGASVVVLAVAVVASLVGGTLTTRSPNFLLPSSVIDCYLVGVFVLLLALGLMISFGHSGELEDAGTPGRGVVALVAGPEN